MNGLYRPCSVSKKLSEHPGNHRAAEITGAVAIHPGYGFLSETPTLPSRLNAPALSSSARKQNHSPDGRQSIRNRGDEKSRLPCVPGSDGPLGDDMDKNRALLNALVIR